MTGRRRTHLRPSGPEFRFASKGRSLWVLLVTALGCSELPSDDTGPCGPDSCGRGDPSTGALGSATGLTDGADATGTMDTAGTGNITGTVDTTRGADTDAADGSSSAAADSTATAGTTAGAQSEGSSSSGLPPDPCETEPHAPVLVWAADAETDGHMALDDSTSLPGGPCYLSSSVAGVGTAWFSVDLACADTVQFWGLVWDVEAGVHNNDPDSYFYSVDDEPPVDSDEAIWVYGCTTAGVKTFWSWQPVRPWGGKTCEATPEVKTLEAGIHRFGVRNREAGGGMGTNRFAGIAAIVVSNDPDFDPNTLYDPSLADDPQGAPACRL